MATWQTATDAFGIVNPQGNRGAAQIFKGDAVDTNLDRLDKAQAVKLATQNKKKAEQDAMRDALKLEYGGWKAADGQKLGELYQQWLQKGQEGILKGINPKDNTDLLQMGELIKTAAKTGEEERKYYEKAMMTFMENKDQYDPEEAQNFLERADKYFKAGFGNRKAEDLWQPKKIEAEKPINWAKELVAVKPLIGTFKRETPQSRTVNKVGVDEAASVIYGDPKKLKAYMKDYGFTDENEAKEDIKNKLIAGSTLVEKTDFAVKDNSIGRTQQEIEQNFEQWKNDFVNNEKSSMSYVIGAGANFGTGIIESIAPSRSSNITEFDEITGNPINVVGNTVQDGFTVNVKIKTVEETKDGRKNAIEVTKPYFVPYSDTEMMKHLYYNTLNKIKVLYLGEKGKEVTVQPKPTAETNTPKTPSAVKFKGVPKGGF